MPATKWWGMTSLINLIFLSSYYKGFFGVFIQIACGGMKSYPLSSLNQSTVPYPSIYCIFHDPIFHLFLYIPDRTWKRTLLSFFIFAISQLDMSMLLRPSGILGRAVVSARSAAVLVGSSSSSSSNGRFMGTSTRHDNDPEVCYLQLPNSFPFRLHNANHNIRSSKRTNRASYESMQRTQPKTLTGTRKLLPILRLLYVPIISITQETATR